MQNFSFAEGKVSRDMLYNDADILYITELYTYKELRKFNVIYIRLVSS